MSPLARLRSLWKTLFRRRAREADLEQELEAYLVELAGEFERRGLSEAESRRAARLELGAVDDVKESVRASWSGEWIHTLLRDVRYSARALRKRPTFTAVSVLTLALGLGGATAVFSALNGVLFQPPPGIFDPSGVAAVHRLVDGEAHDGLSYPDFEHVRRTTRTFRDVAAHVGTPLRLRSEDGSRRNVIVDFATGNYFGVLGVRPALGRVFGEDDAEPGSPRSVLVLSDRFWRTRLGADSTILGRALDLGDTRFTVIGIAPAGFEGTMTGQHVDAWVPLPLLVATRRLDPDFHLDRDLRLFSVFGRLGSGVTDREAQAELGADTITVRGSFGRYPEFRDQDAPFFRLLGGAVALLLLLACANVAALFLLRATARRHELAARLALGAPRSALARQLLVEGGMIAGAACAIGGVGAHVFVNRSAALSAQFGAIGFGVDARVLAFTGGVATLTTLLVAALPILRAGRLEPMTALRSATAGGLRSVSTAQRTLVVFQVAVSLTLVATASLIFGNIQRLLSEDPGFDPRNVALVYFDPRVRGWDEERARAVLTDVQAGAERHPEITSATLGTMAPLLGRSRAVRVYRDGEAPAAPAPVGDAVSGASSARLVAAGPGYFETLGIPVTNGRGFVAADGADAEPVAVVSARLARSLWGEQNAVGRHLELERADQPPLRMRVVGLAAGHKHTSISDADPLLLYAPIAQSPLETTLLIARGRTGVPSRDALIDILAEGDPELFADALWTMDELMNGWVRLDRNVSTWMGVFGALAIFLAALGVYGVVAHVARERMRDLAVRSALGATPRQLVVLLVGMGLRLAVVGGLAGGVLLAWTQPIVHRSLEGMSGVDLRIVGACAAVLLFAMALASYLPASRAARIAPVEVLRQD